MEPLNRKVFASNDAIDMHAARPVAVGYRKIIPSPFQAAVRNIFSNSGEIENFSNNILQLNSKDATEDLMRFAMSSTFGLGGLLDLASPAGLPKHHEDFGLTLGHYRVPTGPYLVLPLVGPSIVRDSTEWIFSYFVDPTGYFPDKASMPLLGLNFISARADFLGATDVLQQAALDKYSFVRDTYVQRRKYLITGGKQLSNYGADMEPRRLIPRTALSVG